MNQEDLIGEWRIERVMTNSNRLPTGTMKGVGYFNSYKGTQLLYRERLWHKTENGDLFLARKSYLYGFRINSINIYFHEEENKGLFMTLFRRYDRNVLIKPFKQIFQGHGTCKADSYFLKWNWIDKDHFTMHYQVTGPKKNYRIESRCAR